MEFFLERFQLYFLYNIKNHGGHAKRLVTDAHPTSTRFHIHVSGKKVRNVTIGGGPPPGDDDDRIYITSRSR